MRNARFIIGAWSRRLAVAAAFLLTASTVGAQTYTVDWYTVDGGGATASAGGPYVLGGTAGQPDASGALVGGSYSLVGGFWAVSIPPPDADVSVSKTDGQANAVPTLPITYTIVVANAGPDPTSALVTDVVPPEILGATWTCTGSGAATCGGSGNGNISDTVSLPVGESVTYTLTGTVAAGAAGVSNTASASTLDGVNDPNTANNSATDTDGITLQADLSISKTDGHGTAVPGAPITYTIVVSNSGPNPSSATVTDTPPAAITGVTWSCVAAGSATCGAASGSTGINDSPTVGVGGTVTYTLSGTIMPSASGSLSNTATVAASGATDPVSANNTATDTDLLLVSAKIELTHGARLLLDLASAGVVPDVDVFRLRQSPYASYEVIVDAASGDIGASGPFVERVAPDGTTVLQSSDAVGTGSSRSLRWANDSASAIDDETVRVRSAGCTTTCGTDDVYRIRAYETTASIPRFNNAGSQLTVLLLQNPGDQPIAGTIYFWNAAGSKIAEQAFTLAARATLVLNTATAAPATAGAITVTQDGPYGVLTGKAVALEPATGFSFDSPMVVRVP